VTKRESNQRLPDEKTVSAKMMGTAKADDVSNDAAYKPRIGG